MAKPRAAHATDARQSTQRRPDRTPIPIAEIRLNVHRAHTSQGCQQATRITARTDTRPGHELEYWPWIRAFKISYFATSDAIAPESGFIPEGEVVFWIPADADMTTPPRTPRDGAE